MNGAEWRQVWMMTWTWISNTGIRLFPGCYFAYMAFCHLLNVSGIGAWSTTDEHDQISFSSVFDSWLILLENVWNVHPPPSLSVFPFFFLSLVLSCSAPPQKHAIRIENWQLCTRVLFPKSLNRFLIPFFIQFQSWVQRECYNYCVSLL